MNAIISLITTVTMLFSSLTGWISPAQEEAAPEAAVPAIAQQLRPALEEKDASAPEPADAPKAEAAQTLGSHADIDYADIEYTEYDDKPFYDRTDELYALADTGDAEDVIALYDELYDEFLLIDTLTTISSLHHDADIRDAYWSDEYARMNNVWMTTSDSLSSACRHIMESSCAEAFAAHVGADAAAEYSEYEALSDTAVDAQDRELALEDEYYDLCDRMDGLTFSWRGEEWSYEMVYGDEGDEVYYAGHSDYFDLLDALQQAINEAFAPLYIELVQLRQSYVREFGYDSYVEYAYESVYGRDYTAEDAQKLCDAVKPIARTYYRDLYYSDLFYDADSIGAGMEAQDHLDALAAYIPSVSEKLTAPLTYMTDHGLYDLQRIGPGRGDFGYTTELSYYGAPFIFLTLDDSGYDLISLTHEFGHYCDAYFHPNPNVLTATDSFDLCEIHSNGLQALFTAYYEDILGRDGKTLEFINLGYLLENIIDGCVYDEFQRRVFAEADTLTPAEVNRIYIEVAEEYGADYGTDWDSAWAMISHNFDSPFYYISYAVSALPALEIWDMAQEDRDAAVAVYLDVLEHGAFDEGYLEVLQECGLHLFTETGVAADICRPVMQHMQALEKEVGHSNY